MLKIAASALILGSIFFSVSPSSAYTCKELADNCAKRGGTGCFESSRMAQCKSTNKYVAPSGRVWTAGESGATCEENAAACAQSGGGAACNSPERLAQCHKTGYWTGPSGRRYKVSR